MSARPAVFLDRDGTLIEERSYPSKPEDIVALPGAGVSLAQLREAGFLCLLVTNQSAVARGMITEEELGELHAHLGTQLAADGGELDGIYYCPHHPEGIATGYGLKCRCRKPGTGLFELACSEHDIDLARSVFVGDATRDLFLGVAPQAGRVLVRSGHPLPPDASDSADAIVDDITDATAWILALKAEQDAAELTTSTASQPEDAPTDDSAEPPSAS